MSNGWVAKIQRQRSHFEMKTYFSWTDDQKPLRTTYSTPLLTVTTIIIVVSQVSSFVLRDIYKSSYSISNLLRVDIHLKIF